MDEKRVEHKIKAALKRLHKNDAPLLEQKFDINERTVTFRLGMYLVNQFKEFDVDCEYNRIVDHKGDYTEGDYWAKWLNLSCGTVSGEDDEAHTVFPDIIIHKRKRTENLVVIEVKMLWKNGKRKFDLEKLQAYKRDLKYTHAVYVEIGEKKSTVHFINLPIRN